ncbi:nucleolus protein [Kockovaella imperatae]|uniref:25S rRNA adenine-N(1) methyltransferase n=1 Tax=Kockovaella imperatae TaxID=4999 RepID=A0A1Y1ULI8_9TREE|nr:nucleolus protein [Kockovaella imperatae]ORX38849.1 nucleolus protein [Kockovaella imperatae]
MANSRKVRKRPVTLSKDTKPGLRSNSHKATQQTISKFHVLLKRKAALTKQLKAKPLSEKKEEDVIQVQLAQVDRELDSLGGIEAYQKASVYGQSVERGGDSAKVLIEWLKKRDASQIELGALKPDNLASCASWIENHPIDLHSLHPDIEEQDFFNRPLPTTDMDHFDIISCSLVLNFVDDSERRGQMLRLIHRHLASRASSLLFLVLPLPCVKNSRYVTLESLRNLMRCVGFEQVEERWKEGGKVGYWLYTWRDPTESNIERWGRKRVLVEGPKRNNFAILLK